jgi:hypothetical protein
MSTRRTSSPCGSLAEHGPGFRGYLVERGYSASVANKHLQLLADLSRWLEREGICADELDTASTEGFFRRRRAQGRANLRTPCSLDPLLAYLRQLGVIETRSNPHRASATADSSGPLPTTRRPPRLPPSPVIMPTVTPTETPPDQLRRPPTQPVVGIIAGSA